MDRLRILLEAVRKNGLATGKLRGFFHILIGRKITTSDGLPISTGHTWRELALLLKSTRFEPDLVRELGVDPNALSPRDRQRFWYSAIATAKPDSAEAVMEAEELPDPTSGPAETSSTSEDEAEKE
jgi:hypothetical protein